MLFTFKRDEEGRERIYVGDVCVARMCDGHTSKQWRWATMPVEAEVDDMDIDDAIERADEAGFWRAPKAVGMTVGGGLIILGPCFQVTVDVPIADNAVLSVTTEDES